MTTELEFIITVKPGVDIDMFYDDMESKYGDNEIPSRIVECGYRRPLSRSTHYFLSPEEAAKVATDSRVESIQLTYEAMGHKIVPLGIQQTGNFDKSGTQTATDLNWGLLRSYERAPRANWGSDGSPSVTATIELDNIGRNVDVVIIDGHIPQGHPEFAVNADGTGGDRLNRFNWFQYNQEVRGIAAGTYVYDYKAGADEDNNHGTHVAGTACGNTGGWARGSNVYNISPYTASTDNNYTNYFYDMINYVRVWHQNKAVNPKIGRRNPTIVNMSFGMTSGANLDTFANRIVYQGITYTRPGGGWTSTNRINFGLVAQSGTTSYWYARDNSLDADIADAIADGIIFVGAAGNFYMYNDIPTGANYNNSIQSLYLGLIYLDYYYMRGPSPAAAPGVIHVSSIDSTVAERKADYSNAGPRTDIFAAGSNIMSSYYTGGVSDPRNASYQKYKSSGTSMASPQVTGLLACALEIYPAMTPTQALDYIKSTASNNVLADSAFTTTYPSTSYTNYNSLFQASNRYAMYKTEKLTSAQTWPRKNYLLRPSTGRTFPRSRVRSLG